MHRSSWLLASVVAVAMVCLAAAAPARATTFEFSNSTPITINHGGDCPFLGEPGPNPGRASPYPSTIFNSGLGIVADVNVTLLGLTHTRLDDVDVLLVGPRGQATLLMADVGIASEVRAVNLTFDDAAANSLPKAEVFASIVSGTYKPSVGAGRFLGCPAPVSFPLPAPGAAPGGFGAQLPPVGPYASSLSVFNGTFANGTWSLYVIDDNAFDVGSISGGWRLEITTLAARIGPTPEDMIIDLHGFLVRLGLPDGLATALDSKLAKAFAALEADDTADACGSLKAFLNLVSAQTGKKLTAFQAEELTDLANLPRRELDC